MKIFNDINTAIRESGEQLVSRGLQVLPGEWQSLETDAPVLELYGWSFRVPIPESKEVLQEESKCDLPWAEDHFRERISGEPLNPGKSYKDWPHYKMTDREDTRFRNNGGKFSHTYMERFWPKQAGRSSKHFYNKGLRFDYGDLNDVIDKLIKNRGSRQAFLPVWFPEDTGLTNQRVPCTLGYLFNIRNNFLHVTYYIRSCDYARHFHNDVYMAGRLAQFVRGKIDNTIKTGFLDMHIASFHIFESDLNFVNKKILKYVRNTDNDKQS